MRMNINKNETHFLFPHIINVGVYQLTWQMGKHIAEIEQEYIENRNITLLKQLKQILHILETRSDTTFWKQSLWYTNSKEPE